MATFTMTAEFSADSSEAPDALEHVSAGEVGKVLVSVLTASLVTGASVEGHLVLTAGDGETLTLNIGRDNDAS